MTIRIAVLASGRGSNLQAILDAIADGVLDAQVVGVFSDKPGAEALQRVSPAQRWAQRPKDFASREDFEAAMGDALAASTADWIVCAGYMRIIGAVAVEDRVGRMLNIHPSLLPAFKGLHTHRQALAAGVAEHGASVHFVTPDLDGGPVLAQARIPVHAGEDEATLAARVLAREHPLLVAALRLFAGRRVALRERIVHVDGRPLPQPLQLTANDGFA